MDGDFSGRSHITDRQQADSFAVLFTLQQKAALHQRRRVLAGILLLQSVALRATGIRLQTITGTTVTTGTPVPFNKCLASRIDIIMIITIVT